MLVGAAVSPSPARARRHPQAGADISFFFLFPFKILFSLAGVRLGNRSGKRGRRGWKEGRKLRRFKSSARHGDALSLASVFRATLESRLSSGGAAMEGILRIRMKHMLVHAKI